MYAEFLHRIDRQSLPEGEPPPFLPIELFKHYRVATESTHELVFKSSGTTGLQRAEHYIHDAELYRTLARQAFERRYGSLNDWVVLAFLPSYVEQGDSSLVFMVNEFIRASGNEASNFVLHRSGKLSAMLSALASRKIKTLLIGVSYALLDQAEHQAIDFPELIVMETGGMKGRRQELTREELHAALKKGFPTSDIHSEYGMTELLSQAYSLDGQWFQPAPWMRCYITEVSDPARILPPGARGLLAFADLANVYSCSFIQTRDIGMVNATGQFTVEGRLDNSDMRGCNLLYT